jgi:outer membrane protein assembly factor BamD
MLKFARYFFALCALWMLFATLSIAQEPAAVPGQMELDNEGPPAAGQAALAEAEAVSPQDRSTIGTLRTVAKQQRFSPEGADALFRLAQILQASGQPDRAFDAYNSFITDYPDSPRFDEAIRAQVEIANLYLDGRRVRFLGLPLLSGYEKAEKMLNTVIANAPFSKYAPMAQFNLGLAFERQGRLAEAIAAYQGVLDRYPGSQVADNALYQIGYVYMVQGTSGRSEDLSALVDARYAFEDFLMFYPESEKAAQARENLDLLLSRETGDVMGIARFYDRSRDYRSAFIYYNEVIRRGPNTQDAEIAQIRIDELRADFGDDALRTGPEQVQTGERIALRRRLQSQVETTALADYAGPPRDDLVREELPVARPRLRTEAREISPLPALPPIEPELPEF